MNISRKRLNKIKSIKDEDINYSDIPELDETFFKNAKIVLPQKKKLISIRLDQEVFDWFKDQGEGYQTRINAILKAYMEAHEH